MNHKIASKALKIISPIIKMIFQALVQMSLVRAKTVLKENLLTKIMKEKVFLLNSVKMGKAQILNFKKLSSVRQFFIHAIFQ